jgi:hypothetical protein
MMQHQRLACSKLTYFTTGAAFDEQFAFAAH